MKERIGGEMERKNCWTLYSEEQLNELENLNAKYRAYLDNGKTERECVDVTVNMIEAAGYREMETLIKNGETVKAGDKVYSVIMNKAIVMYHIGEKPITEGMNILGAHIDSPRIDVKQNPLYDSDGLAYLDTHYYGGIKKFHWVAQPLALHGVVVKKDGTIIELNVGENEDDPVFFISDILVHLSRNQMSQPASNAIEGEALDLIVGNKPLIIKNDEEKAEDSKDEKKKGVKDGIIEILKSTYGIEEDDFISAELEIVPAGKAREVGFDRSMILAYGQDDRVCAYTSVQAMLDVEKVDRTICCLIVDKEEIGSAGASGMQSMFFENSVAELLNLMGEYTELNVRRTLAHSCMLSSDVSAGYDPMFAGCFEKKNSAFLGNGMVINKYTGAGGKSGSNDASAEYVAQIRAIFEKRNINFQTAELGKVDQGGGGTVAGLLAKYCMNVIDSGVAVLNMHAPYEATSKADIYETYRGYKAFIEEAVH